MGIFKIREKISQKLKSSPKAAVYLAVAALCALALIIMKPSDKQENEPVQVPEEPERSLGSDYAESLAEELEEIISRIRGVGEVRVMLTLEGTEEKIYAEDTSESDSKQDAKTVVIGSKEALLKATKYPEVRGVLVVCDGGGKPSVKEKVVNAVATVLDIPTGKVFVTDTN